MLRLPTKIFHLAECPIWDPLSESLFWVDILNGEIWTYNISNEITRLVWKSNLQIGGIVICDDMNIIACTSSGIFKLFMDDGNVADIALLYDLNFEIDERFNDVTVDPAGRLLAGTKRADLTGGKLFVFESGKPPRVLLQNLGISNGMTFSLDHRYLYHTDSLTFTVMRYDYDIEQGEISNPSVFFKGDQSTGFPDGITMDSHGRIWIAFWGSSCVRCIDEKGLTVKEIRVPALQPSSLAFGGRKLNTLYITTACEGGVDLTNGTDEKGNFLGGYIYLLETDSVGRKEWLATI